MRLVVLEGEKKPIWPMRLLECKSLKYSKFGA
jgi:hypothetical protein